MLRFRRPVLKVHRISNRKHTQHSDTYIQTVALYWTTTRKKRSTVTSWIIFMHVCYRMETQSGQVCRGPPSAQRLSTGSYGFFEGGAKKKKLQLTLTTHYFSVIHTVHTPTPSPSCLRTVMAASIKHTVCIYDVSIQYTHSHTAACRATIWQRGADEVSFFLIILWHHWDTHDMTLPRIQWDTHKALFLRTGLNRLASLCVWVCVCVCVYVCVYDWERSWS